MKDNKECKRQELMHAVDLVEEDKLDDLMLLLSGFIAGIEVSQMKESA